MADFKVWVESPSTGSGGNIETSTEFNTETRRINGYQPDTTVPSVLMNTILRQNSLAVTALMNAFCADVNINVESNLTAVTNALTNGIASKAALDNILYNADTVKKAVSADSISGIEVGELQRKILYGTEPPSADLGEDGDVYIQY